MTHLGDYAAKLAAHDAQNWMQEPGFPSHRHNALHVGIAAGDYARHAEAVEDGRISSDTPLNLAIAADLVILGLRAFEIEGVDPDEALRVRMQQIRERAAQVALQALAAPEGNASLTGGAAEPQFRAQLVQPE